MSRNADPGSQSERIQAQYGYLPLLMSIGLALGMVIGSSLDRMVLSGAIGLAVGAACWLVWRVSTRTSRSASESEDQNNAAPQES